MTPEYGTTALAETCSSSAATVSGNYDVTAVVSSLQCSCTGLNGQLPGNVNKAATGDCTSVCPTFGNPGDPSPTCVATVVTFTASDGTSTTVNDACSAPYLVGVGAVWDTLGAASLPANAPVVSPAGPVVCQCEGTKP
jgi:hypothetical protein